MNKKDKFLIFLVVNIPIIFMFFLFFITFFSIRINLITQYFLLTYCSLPILLILYILWKLGYLVKIKERYVKNDKLNKALIFLNKHSPKGIVGIIVAFFMYVFFETKKNVESYYNRVFIDYLKELGGNISAIDYKIVFEPISLSGFDFFKLQYFIMYISDFIFNHLSIILIANIILILFFIKKKFFLFILFTLLNTLIYSTFISTFTLVGSVINLKEMEARKLLLESLDSAKEQKIIVKYPLLSDILKDEKYEVSIKRDNVKIIKEKQGLISRYIEESINIIHPDSVFCSLRNYNLSTSRNWSSRLFDEDAGFKNDSSNIKFKISYQGFNRDNYDIEISTPKESILFKNTYLEYDGIILNFRNLNSETGVSLKCENSLYSLYYKKNKIGSEKFSTFDTFLNDLINMNVINPEFGQTYRGNNINDENPYKCNQVELLNLNKETLKKYKSKTQYGRVCDKPSYPDKIDNMIERSKYNENK